VEATGHDPSGGENLKGLGKKKKKTKKKKRGGPISSKKKKKNNREGGGGRGRARALHTGQGCVAKK